MIFSSAWSNNVAENGRLLNILRYSLPKFMVVFIFFLSFFLSCKQDALYPHVAGTDRGEKTLVESACVWRGRWKKYGVEKKNSSVLWNKKFFQANFFLLFFFLQNSVGIFYLFLNLSKVCVVIFFFIENGSEPQKFPFYHLCLSTSRFLDKNIFRTIVDQSSVFLSGYFFLQLISNTCTYIIDGSIVLLVACYFDFNH